MSGNRYDQMALGWAKNMILSFINGSMSSDKLPDGSNVGHDHNPNTPGNGGQVEAPWVKFIPSGDITAANVSAALEQLNAIANLGRVHVPVRQTVLCGRTDPSTGQANFLGTTSGLNIDIAASTPLVIAFAYNFDSTFGQLDCIGKITADITSAWASLPANQSAIFLYIDRDILNGNLTRGYSLLAPIYSTIAPSSPTVDQHWFDLNSFYMKRWTGSAWEIKQRVFVGECVTGSNTVTSVITYALKGQYDSRWFPVAANSNYTKNHYIGIKIPDGLQVHFYFSIDANGNDASFAHDVYTSSGYSIGHYSSQDVANNSKNIINFGFGTKVQIYQGAEKTTGYYRIFMKRGW